jgi:hypothetical protein
VGRVSRIRAFPAGTPRGSRAGTPHSRLPSHLDQSAARGRSRRIQLGLMCPMLGHCPGYGSRFSHRVSTTNASFQTLRAGSSAHCVFELITDHRLRFTCCPQNQTGQKECGFNGDTQGWKVEPRTAVCRDTCYVDLAIDLPTRYPAAPIGTPRSSPRGGPDHCQRLHRSVSARIQ